MNEVQARHARLQSAVSAMMTVLMNSLMTFVLLSGAALVPVWGMSGVAFDLVPTTFMSIVMSAVMPGIITEKKMRENALQPLAGPARFLPGNAFVRALLLAVAGAILFGGVFAAALLVSGASVVDFWAVLAFKAVFGAAIGWFVAPIAVRETLRPARGAASKQA